MYLMVVHGIAWHYMVLQGIACIAGITELEQHQDPDRGSAFEGGRL